MFMVSVIIFLALVFASLLADFVASIMVTNNYNVNTRLSGILNQTPSFFFVVACILNSRNWASFYFQINEASFALTHLENE